jgi:hypothetical protein
VSGGGVAVVVRVALSVLVAVEEGVTVTVGVELIVFVAVEVAMLIDVVFVLITVTVGIADANPCWQAVAPNTKAPPITRLMNLFMGSIPDRAASK